VHWHRIKIVFKTPEFNADEVGTDMLKRFQVAKDSSDLQVINSCGIARKDGAGSLAPKPGHEALISYQISNPIFCT
jgi:hypothetical protein